MSFHIGLLGSGKTGGRVLELIEKRRADGENIQVTVFNRSHPVTADNLAGLDGLISFYPGPAFLEAIPTLMDSRLPVVTGSTGFEWPGGRQEFHQTLANKDICWIHGHNFGLGMNLVRQMIATLSKAQKLYAAGDIECSIHEVHHTKKLDAPSGTAIAWSDWLGMPAQISSERTGDVVGDHQLTLKTPFEQIQLRHQALDRKIFAAGALWAMEALLNETIKSEPGLHVFQDVAIELLLK